MFPPPKQPMQPGMGPPPQGLPASPMGGAAPPPTLGGAGGFQPQPPPPMPGAAGPPGMGMPAASPMTPAIPQGQQPMSPQQMQLMDVISQSLLPQELEVVKQCLTPELVAVVVKLFGPQVSQLLDPLIQVANSNQMIDAGDGIGGTDMAGMGGMPGMAGGMGEPDYDDQGMYSQGSVSSPFRGIRAGY